VTDSSAGIVASGNYTPGEPINFAGASLVFEGQPADGDTFTVDPAPTRDLFSTVAALAGALSASGSDPAAQAAVNNAMARGLTNLDQAVGHILNTRAEVGARLQRIESQLENNAAFTLQLQQTLSEVRDLDYAEAISRFQQQLAALEAAQQTYITTQRLSLFNYL